MLGYKLKLWLVLLTSMADIPATLTILSHGTHWGLITTSIINFKFTSSFVDLLLFAIVRTSIIFGGIIGLLCRKWDQSTNMFLLSHSIWVWFVSFYYMAIKLLLVSGDPSFKLIASVWLWLLLCWNLIASCLFILLWHQLSVIQNTSTLTCLLMQENEYENIRPPAGEQHKKGWFKNLNY